MVDSDRRKILAIIASVIYLYGLSISLFEIKDRYMDEGSQLLYVLTLLMWLAYETSWKSSSKWFRRIAKLFSFLILVLVGFLSGILLLADVFDEIHNWDALNSAFLCLFLLCILFIINLNLPRNTKT